MGIRNFMALNPAKRERIATTSLRTGRGNDRFFDRLALVKKGIALFDKRHFVMW